MITQLELKSVLQYCPKSGIFTWKISPSKNIKKGSIAGCYDKVNKYNEIRFNGKKYKSHRLAWLYVYGDLPKYIDHINQDKVDNRIINLRKCTNKQNQFNSGLQKNNKTGYKGVSYSKTYKKYVAQAKIDGVNITIGYFEKKDDAAIAYFNYTKDIHKEFGFFPNVTIAR